MKEESTWAGSDRRAFAGARSRFVASRRTPPPADRERKDSAAGARSRSHGSRRRPRPARRARPSRTRRPAPAPSARLGASGCHSPADDRSDYRIFRTAEASTGPALTVLNPRRARPSKCELTFPEVLRQPNSRSPAAPPVRTSRASAARIRLLGYTLDRPAKPVHRRHIGCIRPASISSPWAVTRVAQPRGQHSAGSMRTIAPLLLCLAGACLASGLAPSQSLAGLQAIQPGPVWSGEGQFLVRLLHSRRCDQREEAGSSDGRIRRPSRRRSLQPYLAELPSLKCAFKETAVRCDRLSAADQLRTRSNSVGF